MNHINAPFTQGLKGQFETHNACNIYDASGDCVASIPGLPLHTSLEEMRTLKDERYAKGKALASLLTAAPELLRLLYLALPYVEEGEEFNKPTRRNLSKDIRAALAKTEGGAQ